MSRTATFALGALAAVLALAGCGGGGEGSPDASTASSPQQRQEAPQATLPAPQPGSKAAAPGVPTSEQGDSSIQTWGVEAGAGQRARFTTIVQSYLDARADRRWASVCALLAAKPRTEQSRGGGTTCARAMTSFAAGAAPATLRREARIDVLSLRRGGGYAFLIYRRPDGVYATALTREGSGWKIVSATPAPVR
jgi:hypothetical protein